MRAKGGAAVYWLWLFCLYSFLGYLLEKAFAAATGSRHQVRTLQVDVDLRMSQCFQRFFRLGVHPGIIQQQSLLNGTPHKNVIRDTQI